MIQQRGTCIALGSDHAGFQLKEAIGEHLRSKGCRVEDVGTHSTEAVDYPVYAAKVAEAVASGRCPGGIMVDGAGIGSSMVVNKVPGVRGALCYDLSTARNSREHNDANVLALGSRMVGTGLALEIVDLWLSTDCTVDRHKRRVQMIGDVESRYCGGGVVVPSESAAAAAVSGSGGGPVTMRDIERIATAVVDQVLSSPGLSTGYARVAACGADTCVSCGLCVTKSPQEVQGIIQAGADRITYAPGGTEVPKEVAKYIDHTLLKPEATPDQIRKLCEEALQYGFATVCINPNYVPLAADILRGSASKVCTVAGFPLGAHATEIKAQETRRAIRDGALEVDMVINIGALKSRDDKLVRKDIAAVADSCHETRAICKVIIEAALLTDEEKTRACLLAKSARADFVKTSTGFGPGGATAHDVDLMRQAVVGTRMGVKAAGGIRSYEDAQKMIEAGATRIGASAGVEIVQEARGKT